MYHILHISYSELKHSSQSLVLFTIEYMVHMKWTKLIH